MFEEQVIKEKQDLTYLSWSKIRNSSGTAGSFLKSYSDLEGDKIYYKLSNYDRMNGIYGHECINEIVVDRLLSILGVEHLKYLLIHADILVDGKVLTTYLCASEDFKKRGDSKAALDTYYEINRNEDQSPLEFCIDNGWEKYIYQMLLVDYLILNRDRHGANIEVLRNTKEKSVRLAPLFDHGLSLLYHCHSDADIENVDVMEDKKVQCFVGCNSTFENLSLIPKDYDLAIKQLQRTDESILFADIEEFTSKIWRQKVWEMIWRRWEVYETLFDKK